MNLVNIVNTIKTIMKKITQKIVNAIHQNSSDMTELEEFKIDAVYQRMFDRDIYLHISEVSVVMLGVCLTGVSILNVDQDINSLDTYIDDLLAIDAFVFLTSYLLSYWIIRVMTKSNRNIRKIGNIANAIFIIGMICMAIVCGMIVIKGDFSLS
jgi:hypothetical protein